MTRKSKRQCLSTRTKQTSVVCTNDIQTKEKQNKTEAQELDNAKQDGQKEPVLPNEIMGLIFNHLLGSPWTLYECTLTSKQWYRMANPLLWHSPVFNTDVFNCLYAMPGKRRRRVGKLIQVLQVTSYFDDDELLFLLPCLAQLKHLTVTCCDSITDKSLSQLPQYCPNLSSIKLHALQVTAITLIALGQCPIVDFEWITPSPPLSVSSLAHLQPCPLRRLCFGFAEPQIGDAAITAIKPFHTLTCLDLSGMYTRSLKPLLVNTVYPRLTMLRLAVCSEIDDTALVSFFNTHTQLEQLILERVHHFTDITLEAMVHLPRLTRIGLIGNQHITSTAVRRLINACPVTSLDVTDCRNLVVADFPELESIGGVMDQSILDRIRQDSRIVI